jgi:hypothetical protein
MYTRGLGDCDYNGRNLVTNQPCFTMGYKTTTVEPRIDPRTGAMYSPGGRRISPGWISKGGLDGLGDASTDVLNLPTTGPTPTDLAMVLNPLPNNPLSATGQSNLSPAQLDSLSALNAQYFNQGSSLTSWINANSTYLMIGGAALLALMLFSGRRRR